MANKNGDLHRVWLRLLALAVLLAGCGGTPAPLPAMTPSLVGNIATPLPAVTPSGIAPSSLPIGSVPATPSEKGASAMPAGQHPTATPTVTAITERPTAEPILAASATAATPIQAAITEVPQQQWRVANLMVGPGRIYAFLVSTAQQEQVGGAYQLLLSDDDGKTWSPFPGGLPAAPCLNNVNLDYASRDSLYAGACQGGLYHWTGSDWALISQQRVSKLEVIYRKPEIMWSSDSWPNEPKISRSEDGGRTWVQADAGIARYGVSYLGQDPRDGNTLYAAGPWLYRGTPDGQWKLVLTQQWFPDNAINGMAIEGGNGAVYVSLSQPNQIWRSRNANAADISAIQWELVHDFSEDQAVQLLATGPSPSGLALYANLASIESLEGGGIAYSDYLPYRSPDGGATWERIVMPGWIN